MRPLATPSSSTVKSGTKDDESPESFYSMPNSLDETPWWSFTLEETRSRLFTSFESGLSDSEAARRLQTFGPNELPEAPPMPFWKLVLKQFQDFLVLVLVGAAFISFVLALLEDDESGGKATAFVEPFVIVAILVVNATVGVVQETNAEAAIRALKSYEASRASVIRDGRLKEIKAAELVPGDVVEIAVGARVPADVRLVSMKSSVVRVDQSLLTGESNSVNKEIPPIIGGHRINMVNQEKINMLFSGTLLTRGRAVTVVCGTGRRTQLGGMMKDLTTEDGLDMDEYKSPMKDKLDEFGETLSKLIFAACLLVWLINVRHFSDPERGGFIRGAIYYFKIAVALAVAAVPEGLPAVVTTCLALGAREMAKEGAIVRSLPAVETLGCTTVICTDKTGTITTNQMAVQFVICATSGGKLLEFSVEGTDYTPRGKVHLAGDSVSNPSSSVSPGSKHPALLDVARIASLCNESKLDYDALTRRFGHVGEPTEAALMVLVEKIGFSNDNNPTVESLSSLVSRDAPADAILNEGTKSSQNWAKAFTIEATLEFTRSRKSMSVICKTKQQGSATSSARSLFCKGAPSSILARCDRVRLDSGGTMIMDDAMKNLLLNQANRLGVESFRCLALAQGELPSSLTSAQISNLASDAAKFEEIERKMTFVGLVAMMDPPRPEVSSALAKCKDAGIRVIMITGDDAATAEAVGRRVGLISSEETHESLVNSGASLSGEEWSNMTSSEARREAAMKVVLMHRVEPHHKFDLVTRLRMECGEIVAMTGDGVNDASALRAADIGVSMGSGTAVAREASSIVLADDNFATIVSAVRQGRAIYANTKQFIRYLVSSNLGEVACIFFSAALGVPESLLPVQLLWVNLVTDGLPATALGFNPPDLDVMRRPPRNRRDPLVDRWMGLRFVVVGTWVGSAVVMGFVWWFTTFEEGPKMSFTRLANFNKCEQLDERDDAVAFQNNWTCGTVFKRGGGINSGIDRASTVSLSILVVVEMFNAFNALSENQSLLVVPPWTNKYLILAVLLSLVLHVFILYFPGAQSIFGVAPLTQGEWKGVIWLSFPVVLVDEWMKFVSRWRIRKGGGSDWFGSRGMASLNVGGVGPGLHQTTNVWGDVEQQTHQKGEALKTV